MNFHQPSESSGKREWRPPHRKPPWVNSSLKHRGVDLGLLLRMTMTGLVRWPEGGLKQLLSEELAEQSANAVRGRLTLTSCQNDAQLLELYFWTPVGPRHGSSVVGMVDLRVLQFTEQAVRAYSWGHLVMASWPRLPIKYWHVAIWCWLICGFSAAADSLIIYEATWAVFMEVIWSNNPHWKLIIIIIVNDLWVFFSWHRHDTGTGNHCHSNGRIFSNTPTSNNPDAHHRLHKW